MFKTSNLHSHPFCYERNEKIKKNCINQQNRFFNITSLKSLLILFLILILPFSSSLPFFFLALFLPFSCCFLSHSNVHLNLRAAAYINSNSIAMDSNKINEDILKTFGIEQCSVNLNKTNFSKIRMKCVAESTEKNVKLLCDLKQVDINTFSIKITRKLTDDIDVDQETTPKEQVKFSISSSVQQPNECIEKNISRPY